MELAQLPQYVQALDVLDIAFTTIMISVSEFLGNDYINDEVPHSITKVSAAQLSKLRSQVPLLMDMLINTTEETTRDPTLALTLVPMAFTLELTAAEPNWSLLGEDCSVLKGFSEMPYPETVEKSRAKFGASFNINVANAELMLSRGLLGDACRDSLYQLGNLYKELERDDCSAMELARAPPRSTQLGSTTRVPALAALCG